MSTTAPFVVDKLSLVYGLIKYSSVNIKFRADKAFRLAYLVDESGAETPVGWLTAGEYEALVHSGLVTKEGEVIRV